VIRAETVPGGVALQGELPAGAVAYVDADWIDAAAPGPVPALMSAGGALRWPDGSVVAATDAEGSGAAAAALRAVAEEAASAAGDVAAKRVEVIGAGFIAEHARHLLSVTPAPPGESAAPRPVVIIDVTGAGDAIEDATRRLDDLGTLVLAGEAAGREFPLNFYTHIHSRGLRVVGVGRADAPAAQADFEPPAATTFGAPLRPARWYRVSAPA
jgi:hypothetical protein